MITKTFTQTYPNEPWNPSVSEGKTVEVTWSGIRFYIISVDSNGVFYAIEDQGDDETQIDADLLLQKHLQYTIYEIQIQYYH